MRQLQGEGSPACIEAVTAGCEIGEVLGLLCGLYGPANSKLNGEAGLGSKKLIY